MAKTKYLTYGILILTVVGIILISGCTQEDSQTPKNIDCAREGEKNYFGEPSCCEGLVQIPNAAPMREGCIARPDGSGYCTRCRDGICKSPENKCNCPEDCPSNCAGEGESVPVVPGAPECCEGLTKIGCEKPDNNGICPTEPCVGASICAKCGNGVCGHGENKCNCPKDCEEAECNTDRDCMGGGCPQVVGGDKPKCDLKTKTCYCGGVCGDGYCDPMENRDKTCPQDCR